MYALHLHATTAAAKSSLPAWLRQNTPGLAPEHQSAKFTENCVLRMRELHVRFLEVSIRLTD